MLLFCFKYRTSKVVICAGWQNNAETKLHFCATSFYYRTTLACFEVKRRPTC